ncbi:hypothetical protein KVR01_000639 [Diaporthe batatas]|uniref:uncharacterized protein n=1 Tax=Diaporthe batatas TaxID=748121 RepID=UPI001D04C94D|nr:uncharacterized protein KVR01_000639 [Diaporthe batatas]KAG8169894.1 hypothetical protein KVR01_000639 [Diaporthe batatas]
MDPTVELTLERRQCQVCHERVALKPCDVCKLVYYCCRAHQHRDRAAHEHPCSVIKKALEDLSRQDQDRTKMALKHRKVATDTLNHFDNIVAVEFALGHLNEVLRLCPSDPDELRARDIIPTLFLRLGRDQECYDFIKCYDWAHPTRSLPYLDMRGEDPVECPITALRVDGPMNMNHIMAAMLIKVRILLDLQNMQNATRAFQGVLRQDFIHMIRAQMPLVSNVVAAWKDIAEASVDKTAFFVKLLKVEVKVIFYRVQRTDPMFWPTFLVHEQLRQERVIRGPVATDASLQRSIRYHYEPLRQERVIQGPVATDAILQQLVVCDYHALAWRETPGAIGMLEDLVRAATAKAAAAKAAAARE